MSTLFFRWREVDTLAQPLAEEDDNIPVKHTSFFSLQAFPNQAIVDSYQQCHLMIPPCRWRTFQMPCSRNTTSRVRTRNVLAGDGLLSHPPRGDAAGACPT